MKKLLCTCLIFSFIVSNSYANDRVKLVKINKLEFVELESKIKSNISKDQNNDFALNIVKNDQSFDVIIDNVKIFRLIPISYESVNARNRVCTLSVFSPKNKLQKIINLHFEIPDEDEIVASCIGVQAVAVEHKNNTDYLIYLLRYSAGNQYGDTVFIAAIKSGKINKDNKLTACVSNNEDIDSILKIRKAIKKCLSKTALPGK
jgi:hypothetical protein